MGSQTYSKDSLSKHYILLLIFSQEGSQSIRYQEFTIHNQEICINTSSHLQFQPHNVNKIKQIYS